METTTSADGTTIAYDTWGSGPAVVVVGGAFNDRRTWSALAEALAAEGVTGVSYDRRGRGDSDDTPAAETLEPAKGTPMWNGLLALAPTLVHDAHCMGGNDQALPADLLARVGVPVLAVTSTGTAVPWMARTAEEVAAAAPAGRFARLEGGFHEIPPAVLAPALAEFYRPA
jgi:pimeloyl-ACP methyl ester carboxylesterase